MITIKNADIVAVGVKLSQYPVDDKPEIAFAGRSNVGKSSLINLLLNRRNLARTSGSPGKTRTINFYEVNGTFRIVDLPGYGYARVSKSLSQTWGAMIEEYLGNRPNLRKVIQLVDIRHEPTEQDVQMYQWVRHHGFDGIIAATKADKVNKSQLPKHISVIKKKLQLTDEDKIIPISALKKTGWEALLKEISEILEE